MVVREPAKITFINGAFGFPVKVTGFFKNNLTKYQNKMENIKWQTRDEMDSPTNPMQALRESYSRSPKDMAKSKFDAWVYGVICGWDDDAYRELSIKHNWSEETVKYNKLLHNNYMKSWDLFMLDLKNK